SAREAGHHPYDEQPEPESDQRGQEHERTILLQVTLDRLSHGEPVKVQSEVLDGKSRPCCADVEYVLATIWSFLFFLFFLDTADVCFPPLRMSLFNIPNVSDADKDDPTERERAPKPP